MNLSLSVEQELLVRSLIQQDPCQVNSLATVIWDSLSYTGINDVYNSFGIYFTKQATPKVVLWDCDISVKLPRQAFLEILELAAEYTLTSCTVDDDVTRLRRALKYLKKEIAYLKNIGDSLQYYYATENSLEDTEELIEDIEGMRFSWLEGLQDTPSHSIKPTGSTNVENKTPYQAGKDGAFSPHCDRIKSKLKAINMFQTILGVEDVTEEDHIDEET